MSSFHDIPVVFSIGHPILLGYVEWNQDRTTGMEVCQNEFSQFWECHPEINSHSCHRKSSFRARGHLLLTLFLNGEMRKRAGTEEREGGREGGKEEGRREGEGGGRGEEGGREGGGKEGGREKKRRKEGQR